MVSVCYQVGSFAHCFKTTRSTCLCRQEANAHWTTHSEFQPIPGLSSSMLCHMIQIPKFTRVQIHLPLSGKMPITCSESLLALMPYSVDSVDSDDSVEDGDE